EVAGRFGRIDIWVNDAAGHLFAPFEQAPGDVSHRVVETNLLRAYPGTRAAVPCMREQASAVIANVSSVLGKTGAPVQTAYAATQHGIRAVSACLRQGLRELRDVHVCTVLPGPVDTPLFVHAANYTGRELKPIRPVIDAHRVAD